MRCPPQKVYQDVRVIGTFGLVDFLAFTFLPTMRNLQTLSRLASRTISTSARRADVAMGQSSTQAKGVVPNAPGYKALMRRQQEWTKNDGKMVWQKRGFIDLVQVRGLEILAGVAGVAICAHFLMMIFPKRKE